MGGYYSGRWHWYTRKTTVEECSKVSIREFDHTLLAHRFEAGDPIYYDESRSARMSAWIARKVVGDLFGKNGEPVRTPQAVPRNTGQPFQITRTPCNYGGYRYWLRCPSCGKLYKPYHRAHYACRTCHDLVYASAQEARKPPVSIRDLAYRIDRLTRAELVLRKIDQCRTGSRKYWWLMERHNQLMAGARWGRGRS